MWVAGARRQLATRRPNTGANPTPAFLSIWAPHDPPHLPDIHLDGTPTIRCCIWVTADVRVGPPETAAPPTVAV